MYRVVAISSGITVASFANRANAVDWIEANDTVPDKITRDADGYPLVESQRKAGMFKIVKDKVSKQDYFFKD